MEHILYEYKVDLTLLTKFLKALSSYGEKSGKNNYIFRH